MTAAGELRDVCAVDDVSEDTPAKVDLDGVAVAIFQVGEKHYAMADLCSHGPGSLSEGWVEDGEVECPFHQGRFAIATGQPTAAPCTIAQRTWPVVVRDGRILLVQTR